MQLQRPLAVITEGLEADILAALARADRAFTPPQLHRIVGRHSEDGIRRALQRLTRQGIVETDQVGRAWTYALNRDHLAAGPLIELARLADVFVERARALLAGWAVPARHAALFGSAARGDMGPDSDLDVLVVRPEGADADDERWTDQTVRLSRAFTAWTGNDTRILEYGEEDIEAQVRAGLDAVLAAVAREGIVLAGEHGYLLRTRPVRPRGAARTTARARAPVPGGHER